MSIETNQEKDQQQENLQEQRDLLQQATFAIEGMTCASCSMRIEKGLKKVPGVTDAQVNLATEKALVTYDPTQTGTAQMVQKVEAVGYKALLLVAPLPTPVASEPEHELQTVLALEGMTCASCAMRIEKGLKKVPGVLDAQVNLATERGTVTYDPQQAEIAQLVQKVEAIGYKATPLKQAESSSSSVDLPSTPSAVAVSQEDEQRKRKADEFEHVLHGSFRWREYPVIGAHHSHLGNCWLGVPPWSTQHLAAR